MSNRKKGLQMTTPLLFLRFDTYLPIVKVLHMEIDDVPSTYMWSLKQMNFLLYCIYSDAILLSPFIHFYFIFQLFSTCKVYVLSSRVVIHRFSLKSLVIVLRVG